MDYKKLANLLYPDTTETIEDLLKKYPERNLKPGAEVTRFAPSPTGYLHLGSFYGAFTDMAIAKSTGGIFYFRLEDTDGKRLVDGADKVALNVMQRFGITPDEGYLLDGQRGNYGPYLQSERVAIYNVFAKKLVELGRAYPCFCTARASKEEILQDRENQLKKDSTLEEKDPCRDLTLEEVENHIKNHDTWALRFKSMGKPGEKFTFHDLAKGERVLAKNTIDYVIVKSNGVPVYHLAHVADDTLMRTTTVVRGNEWMGTLPLHIEMFEALGIKPPKYSHTALIVIKDDETGCMRKISKRKDPVADMRYYLVQGYPIDAVNRYVMNLMNSNYEQWSIQNPDAKLEEYKFNSQNLTTSDPMFDIMKLNDISKTVISKMTAEEIYNQSLAWAKEFIDLDYNSLIKERGWNILNHSNDYEILKQNKEKFISILSIDRGGIRPRKDITYYSEIVSLYDYILPDFKVNSSIDFEKVNKEDLKSFIEDYTNQYCELEDNSAWFNNIKEIALKHNFAENKEYKKSPENYAGSIADAVKFVRHAITGRTNTPELYTIMQIIGKENCINRLKTFTTTQF